ncbi:MAG: cysteine peptidase family C39 domain-containing protein, partial [Planctomycetota bacterium]
QARDQRLASVAAIDATLDVTLADTTKQALINEIALDKASKDDLQAAINQATQAVDNAKQTKIAEITAALDAIIYSYQGILANLTAEADLNERSVEEQDAITAFANAISGLTAQRDALIADLQVQLDAVSSDFTSYATVEEVGTARDERLTVIENITVTLDTTDADIKQNVLESAIAVDNAVTVQQMRATMAAAIIALKAAKQAEIDALGVIISLYNEILTALAQGADSDTRSAAEQIAIDALSAAIDELLQQKALLQNSLDAISANFDAYRNKKSLRAEYELRVDAIAAIVVTLDTAQADAAIPVLENEIAAHVAALQKITEHQANIAAVTAKQAECNGEFANYDLTYNEYPTLYNELLEGHPFTLIGEITHTMDIVLIAGALQKSQAEIDKLNLAITEGAIGAIQPHLDTVVTEVEGAMTMLTSAINTCLQDSATLAQEIEAIQDYIRIYIEEDAEKFVVREAETILEGIDITIPEGPITEEVSLAIGEKVTQAINSFIDNILNAINFSYGVIRTNLEAIYTSLGLATTEGLDQIKTYISGQVRHIVNCAAYALANFVEIGDKLKAAVSMAAFDIVEGNLLPSAYGVMKTSALALKRIGETLQAVPIYILNTTIDGLNAFSTPFITFIDNAHYITVKSISDRFIHLVNKGAETFTITLDQFAERWSGIVVTKEKPADIPELTEEEMRQVLGAYTGYQYDGELDNMGTGYSEPGNPDYYDGYDRLIKEIFYPPGGMQIVEYSYGADISPTAPVAWKKVTYDVLPGYYGYGLVMEYDYLYYGAGHPDAGRISGIRGVWSDGTTENHVRYYGATPRAYVIMSYGQASQAIYGVITEIHRYQDVGETFLSYLYTDEYAGIMGVKYEYMSFYPTFMPESIYYQDIDGNYDKYYYYETTGALSSYTHYEPSGKSQIIYYDEIYAGRVNTQYITEQGAIDKMRIEDWLDTYGLNEFGYLESEIERTIDPDTSRTIAIADKATSNRIADITYSDLGVMSIFDWDTGLWLSKWGFILLKHPELISQLGLLISDEIDQYCIDEGLNEYGDLPGTIYLYNDGSEVNEPMFGNCPVDENDQLVDKYVYILGNQPALIYNLDDGLKQGEYEKHTLEYEAPLYPYEVTATEVEKDGFIYRYQRAYQADKIPESITDPAGTKIDFNAAHGTDYDKLRYGNVDKVTSADGYTSSYTYAYEEDHGKALKLTYDCPTTSDIYWYKTEVGDSSNYLDISDYEGLSFRVKGEVGGEDFYIKLDYGAAGVREIHFTDYFAVTDEWQDINIPLILFTGLDKAELKAISIEFRNTLLRDDGTIYLDDLRFVDTDPSPLQDIVVDNYNDMYTDKNLMPVISSPFVNTSSPEDANYAVEEGYSHDRTGDDDKVLKLAYDCATTDYWHKTKVWDDSTYSDITGYTNLSFRVKGKLGGEDFYIKLHDSAGEVEVLSSAHFTVTNGWQDVNIPLTAFTGLNNAELKAISIEFRNTLSTDDGTIYLDNLRFTGTGAPKIVDDYNDVYEDINSLPWASSSLANTSNDSIVNDYSNNITRIINSTGDNGKVLRLSYNCSTIANVRWYESQLWGGSTHLDISDYEELSFRVKGTMRGQDFYVQLHYDAGVVEIDSSDCDVTVTDEWQDINIPLDAFTGLDKTKLEAIRIEFRHDLDTTKGTIYFDDFKFVDTDATPLPDVIVDDYDDANSIGNRLLFTNTSNASIVNGNSPIIGTRTVSGRTLSDVTVVINDGAEDIFEIYYDGNGNVTKIVDYTAVTDVVFNYDAGLVTSTSADTITTEYDYTYNVYGDIIETILRVKGFELHYGSSGELEYVVDPYGTTTFYEDGRILSREDISGNVLESYYYEFDADGAVVKIILIKGSIILTYNAEGRLLSTLDEDGTLILYNDDELVKEVRWTDTDGTTYRSIYTYEYDASDNLTEMTTTTYSAAGDYTDSTITSYNEAGLISSIERLDGDIIEYSYNIPDMDKINTWIGDNELNIYGDPQNTTYMTPFVVEPGGDRFIHILENQTDPDFLSGFDVTPLDVDNLSNIIGAIDTWLSDNIGILNQYGDPVGTTYPPGTEPTDRYNYIIQNHIDEEEFVDLLSRALYKVEDESASVGGITVTGGGFIINLDAEHNIKSIQDVRGTPVPLTGTADDTEAVSIDLRSYIDQARTNLIGIFSGLGADYGVAVTDDITVIGIQYVVFEDGSLGEFIDDDFTPVPTPGLILMLEAADMIVEYHIDLSSTALTPVVLDPEATKHLNAITDAWDDLYSMFTTVTPAGLDQSISKDDITFVGIEEIIWSDTSLGGYNTTAVESYTTPGYKIMFEFNGITYEYHADEERTHIILDMNIMPMKRGRTLSWILT